VRLSAERVEALTLVIVDAIEASPDLRVIDRGRAARVVSSRLISVFGQGDDLDREARAKIASLSRNVPEGSREWDILYRQYLEELRRKS
jgi:hypothetical protein